MLTHEELIKTPEYWMETIQNELYRQVKKFLDEKGINQTQFAEKLHVTKGYVSQVMNGNFNFTLRKLIELSLALGIAPDLEFRSFGEYIAKEEKNLYDGTCLLSRAQGVAIKADNVEIGGNLISSGNMFTVPNVGSSPSIDFLKIAC